MNIKTNKSLMNLFLDNPEEYRFYLISDYQIHIMDMVRNLGKATSRDIADIQGCSVQSASAVLNRLADVGYLKRTEGIDRIRQNSFKMKTTVTVTISSDLMVRVKELAKQEDRSVSAMINVLIRESQIGRAHV